jgi:Archaeal phage integrase
MSRLNLVRLSAHDNEKGQKEEQNSGLRWSESDPSQISWQQFHQFLLQRMTSKTAEDRIRYAKQYASVLQGQQLTLLMQVPPNKRIHIMKALSALARYTGTQSDWLAIRQQYGLQWSTGTEKIDAFTRFFDDTKDLDTMLRWLKEAIKSVRTDYANFFLFCTLTGMRASECVEAVRLLHSSSTSYYNPKQQVLQHYRFPDIFIRRTKAIYISIVNDEIIDIARKINKTPTLNSVKMVLKHRHLSMQLKYCRKIYASWLHRYGISSDLIDMLQGRIGKNIFLKHYLTPSADYKAQVLQALETLQCQL